MNEQDATITDLWFKGCSTPELASVFELTEIEVMQAILRTANSMRREPKCQQSENQSID